MFVWHSILIAACERDIWEFHTRPYRVCQPVPVVPLECLIDEKRQFIPQILQQNWLRFQQDKEQLWNAFCDGIGVNGIALWRGWWFLGPCS